MIDYIVKHQNSAVYSYLFKYNLIDLLKKGVECTKLFNSEVLNYTINYYEWPNLAP